ncbi:MAG: hypothetical protein D6696_17890 [Acidobacteria bacterium]|nr:MAG: hypothetical protein D6696_17890 [Acidobacteriota bacterium]
MDPQRLKQTYAMLESLDERLSYKLRPRGGGSMMRPSTDQLEERLRELATYTLELKDIVRHLIVAIASKPSPPPKG